MTARREFLKRGVATGIAAAFCPAFLEATETASSQARPTKVGMAETVQGPIDAVELGFTLPHEHIADAPGVLKRWPKAWGGKAGLVVRAVDRLKELKLAGVQTVVDLTTYDGGRDIRFLEEVSRKSGLQIIACTGQRFLPPRSAHVSMPYRTVQGLTDFFGKEIDRGIDGTTTKAGVIKLGVVGGQPTLLEEVGLRAAARASKATGVPIRVHTDAAHRAAESIAAILDAEGVSPARVSLDHSDDTADMDYFLGLLRRGYSLSMDHVHRGLTADVKPSFEQRAECIKKIAEAGFAGQLFLSSDTEFGGWLLPREALDWREGIDPSDGMFFVPRSLLSRLEGMGISSDQIRAMTIEHPRSFFGRVAPV